MKNSRKPQKAFFFKNNFMISNTSKKKEKEINKISNYTDF